MAGVQTSAPGASAYQRIISNSRCCPKPDAAFCYIPRAFSDQNCNVSDVDVCRDVQTAGATSWSGQSTSD